MRARHPSPVAAPDERSFLTGITEKIERVLTSVTRVGAEAVSIADAARVARRPLRHADLAPLRTLVAEVLREHDGLTAGAGVVLAPGALAEAPRCIDWWWADRGSGLEQLEVDLDPESADFYDYTTTEWYRTPERTGRPTVAGPYVDYICTHEYTFTLSVPIVLAGRFTGVAGADILAAHVERLVLPDISRLGRVAVLTSGNGRVIASNTATILPGMAVSRQPLAPAWSPWPAQALPSPGPSWSSRIKIINAGSWADRCTATPTRSSRRCSRRRSCRSPPRSRHYPDVAEQPRDGLSDCWADGQGARAA